MFVVVRRYGKWFENTRANIELYNHTKSKEKDHVKYYFLTINL